MNDNFIKNGSAQAHVNERKVIKYVHKLLKAGILEAAGPDRVKFSDKFLDLLEGTLKNISRDDRVMEVIVGGDRTLEEIKDNMMVVTIASTLMLIYGSVEESELMEMTFVIYQLLKMSGEKRVKEMICA